MTANSPSSVAESASSTIDPDAQARRTNDGELSVGMHSDLTIDEDAADGLLTAEELDVEFDENLTMASCTPSIVGWPPNRPPCAGSPRWWRAASNRWRYLARWPRRCADACPRTRPDCGASKQSARLPSWPPLQILRRWPDGRWAPELRWTATPSQRWCDAAAGPHGSTATTTSPGRSLLACAK